MLSADAREGKGSSHSSAAGLGSPARGRRRGPGVGPMGVHGGTAGGRLSPRLPGGGGCAGERELPARTQRRRRSAGLSNHARCWLPGESLLGKKSKYQTTKTLQLPRAEAIEARRSSQWEKKSRGDGETQAARWPRQVSQLPARAYLGGCMSPCGPRGVAWRGCGRRGGAGALLVAPRARREGRSRRWSPPPRPVQQRPGARRLLPGSILRAPGGARRGANS